MSALLAELFFSVWSLNIGWILTQVVFVPWHLWVHVVHSCLCRPDPRTPQKTQYQNNAYNTSDNMCATIPACQLLLEGPKLLSPQGHLVGPSEDNGNNVIESEKSPTTPANSFYLFIWLCHVVIMSSTFCPLEPRRPLFPGSPACPGAPCRYTWQS